MLSKRDVFEEVFKYQSQGRYTVFYVNTIV